MTKRGGHPWTPTRPRNNVVYGTLFRAVGGPSTDLNGTATFEFCLCCKRQHEMSLPLEARWRDDRDFPTQRVLTLSGPGVSGALFHKRGKFKESQPDVTGSLVIETCPCCHRAHEQRLRMAGWWEQDYEDPRWQLAFCGEPKGGK